jgi:hypothetical protein
LNLRVVRQNAETHAIRQALVRAGGNISRTAELLGVTRPTLYDLMAKYSIRAEEADPPAPVTAAEPAAAKPVAPSAAAPAAAASATAKPVASSPGAPAGAASATASPAAARPK